MTLFDFDFLLYSFHGVFQIDHGFYRLNSLLLSWCIPFLNVFEIEFTIFHCVIKLFEFGLSNFTNTFITESLYLALVTVVGYDFRSNGVLYFLLFGWGNIEACEACIESLDVLEFFFDITAFFNSFSVLLVVFEFFVVVFLEFFLYLLFGSFFLLKDVLWNLLVGFHGR